MIKAHNGAFMLNETAAADPAVQAAMASYMDQLKRDARRRELIRAAFRAGQQLPAEGTWNISDRD